MPHSGLFLLLLALSSYIRFALVSHVRLVSNSWNAWLPPRIFHIWCVAILGIPGWASTDDMQPEPWVKARLGCDLSHQVWIVRTSGKGNILLYQRVFPLDPYVHMQAGLARVMIHLGGKDGLR